MVVYPDLAFFMGLALHGGNLYLYLKFHPLSRPRWSQILFLLFSALCSALSVLPEIHALTILFFSLIGCFWFLRGKNLRGTVRNVLFYVIIGCVRFALTLLFCGAISAFSLVFLSAGGYFTVSFLEGLFGAFASFCALFSLLRFRSRRIGEKKIFQCTVILDGCAKTFRCYGDSGNFLTDPVSGLPVAILEYSALRRAFGASFPEPLSYGFAQRFATRARVIPIHGISGTGEMLSAFLPEAFFVDGIPRDGIVAVTPRCLDGCGRFCGIIGPTLSEGE